VYLHRYQSNNDEDIFGFVSVTLFNSAIQQRIKNDQFSLFIFGEGLKEIECNGINRNYD